MPRPSVIICATSLVLFACACWLRAAHGAAPGAATAHEHGHTARGDAAWHAHAAASGTDQAALTVRPEPLEAGQSTLLTFMLTDSSGQPIENLLTHHGRKLHVLIVSEDMQVLAHIHPHDFNEPIEHGVAKAHFSFPQPGRYLVAGDFMTDRGSSTARFVIEVTGAQPAGTPDPAAIAGPVSVVEIGKDDRFTGPIFLRGTEDSDGYTVSLEEPDEIRAGEPVPVVYRFSRDDAPVTDLRPYLAAPLHLAVVKDDLTQFLHEHGTAAVPGHAGHGGHESRVPAAFGPEITATVTFPEPGTYYLFGQAARAGKLLNTRFSVEVR